MLAQKAISSAWYFSLIHESSTEVSRPPEYARTIFILVPNLPANKRECTLQVAGCGLLDVGLLDCWMFPVQRFTSSCLARSLRRHLPPHPLPDERDQMTF